MVNRQPQWTTDNSASGLLEEEDERERVLLVGVGALALSRGSEALEPVSSGCSSGFSSGSEALDRASSGVSRGSEALETSNVAATATYALSVGLVREVIRGRISTRVPGSPVVLRGLVNVRGMVVTVLDLAMCLGLVPAAAGAGTVTEPRAQTPGSIVLLEHGSRLVGLAVDCVREVRALDEIGLVGQPESGATTHGFVRGMASAGGEVVTVLDAAALIARHLISGES